ncbi:MAG TPA: MBL fold metallo-hydrolase [Methylomirabilota bacterium]
MKLRIFQSHKGDCVLLESQDGRQVLCDGGMSASMTAFVAPVLSRLRSARKTLDVVYVSHIDQDHISGVLRLLRDEVEWRIFDYRRRTRHPRAIKPARPRPPEIGGIWHNSFRDQVRDNDGRIEALLAATTPALLATGIPALREMGEAVYDIATSIPEALEVSGLAGPGLLDIPINRLPGAPGPARLLMARPGQAAVRIGSLALTIVGPGDDELEQLREGWNTWLRENGERVDAINDELTRRLEDLGARAPAGPLLDLGTWNGMPDFKGVTVPNIASLMLLVEEDGKRVLLTGDSQQDIILRGLRAAGLLGTAGLHVDVLKVQHHGSEHNLDVEFARQVSADHYVLCGNGEHDNPDLGVLRTIAASRLGPDPAARALAPRAAGRRFTLWFSCTPAKGTTSARGRAHMEKVDTLVRQLARTSRGLMRVRVNANRFVTLSV